MEIHRKISNNVKQQILMTTTSVLRASGVSRIHLVDLCCGRGGDIFKWDKSKIDKVSAFDNHLPSIEEAINRYKKVSKKLKTKINFQHKDVENIILAPLLNNKKVLIISCQFAIHYFKDLTFLLTQISNNLEKGGYFIGVSPDGDIIESIFETDQIVDNVTLERVDVNSYYIDLHDDNDHNTTKDYFNYRDEKLREYVVRKNELTSIAESVGLELCSYCNLKDKWGGNHISNLYFSFVFKKI